MQVSRGTVYLRGKTWTIGYTVGHRRFREAIGTNRQMAEAVLKKRIVQALEGRHFNVRNEGRIPFSEFAATYIERCISVLKSAKTERDRVNFWVREFGNLPIGQITLAELQNWQARKRQVNKPLSPAYKRAMVDRMEQIWSKPVGRPAEMPPTKNRRRLLQRHTQPTKTAAAVNA